MPIGPNDVAADGAMGRTKVIVFDVDGVVSPIRPPRPTWGDEVVAGKVFGPVLVSPELCTRLDRLNETPGVRCMWLTSWTPEMRAAMRPFPGRDWPVVATYMFQPYRTWWKLAALDEWIGHNPTVSAIGWCDDELRGGRIAAARRRIAARGLDRPLVLAPRKEVGLTRYDLTRLESWATTNHEPSAGTRGRGDSGERPT